MPVRKSNGENQFGVQILSTAGEFLYQGCLTAASFSGDEYHPTFTIQCQV